MALPKASKSGFESSTYFSIETLYPTWIWNFYNYALDGFSLSKSSSGPLNPLDAFAKYESIILVASVLPAPDSPVIIID